MAAPTTRVSRTAPPTERVAPSGPIIPAGPTGVMGLPSGRKVPIVGDEAIVGRGNPDGTDAVEIDMTTEVESSTVSRRHARVTRAGAGFEVEDLNSANTTSLNNETLTPGRKYALHKGDVVEFGKVKCIFSIQDR
jgi:pSer/pThr/pTyr-binding forkhead associated (FHA) protein